MTCAHCGSQRITEIYLYSETITVRDDTDYPPYPYIDIDVYVIECRQCGAWYYSERER